MTLRLRIDTWSAAHLIAFSLLTSCGGPTSPAGPDTGKTGAGNPAGPSGAQGSVGAGATGATGDATGVGGTGTGGGGASGTAGAGPADGGGSVGSNGETLTKLAGPSDTITNSSWFNIAWDSKRQRGYATSWTHDLWEFDGTHWSILLPGQGNSWHNCTVSYDPVNDRLWETYCGDETNPDAWSVHYVDLSASSLAWVSVDQPGPPTYDPALIYDPASESLVAFGGWTTFDAVLTLPLSPVGAAWGAAPLAGPPMTYDSIAKMTNERSGWDSARSRIWYVHTDGALWTLGSSLGSWTEEATTGDVPPPMTAFTYDPGADRIVGWYSGALDFADVDNAAARAFYTLDPATLAWTKLTGFSVLPAAGWYTTIALVYDTGNQRVVLKSNAGGSNYDPETWALSL